MGKVQVFVRLSFNDERPREIWGGDDWWWRLSRLFFYLHRPLILARCRGRGRGRVNVNGLDDGDEEKESGVGDVRRRRRWRRMKRVRWAAVGRSYQEGGVFWNVRLPGRRLLAAVLSSARNGLLRLRGVEFCDGRSWRELNREGNSVWTSVSGFLVETPARPGISAVALLLSRSMIWFLLPILERF